MFRCLSIAVCMLLADAFAPHVAAAEPKEAAVPKLSITN